MGFGALDSITLAAAGAGAVSAGVQRVTLASDDPAVALLTTIDADTSALAGTVAGAELQVDIVSAPTLTVNAHAVTNAGTFAVQVDGAALTALQLIDDAIYAEDVAAQAADKGVAILAVRRDADTSLVGTDNDYAQLQVDANGRLKVEAFSGEALPVTLTSTTITGTVTVDGSGATQPVSHAALTELAAAINASSQMDVNIAASSASVAVTNAGITTVAGAVSGTEMQVDVVAALPAGTNAIGKLAANSGVDIGDVDVTSISAGTNLIGDVGLQGRTSGGLSIFRSLDLDETEEEVKATAGQIYACWVTNTATTTRYLKFYNATAANTTVGTTTPLITVGIPGNSSDDIAGIFAAGGHGLAFSTAITAAVTTGAADADTGAPGASDVIVNVFYK